MSKIKIVLSAHTETFSICRKTIPKLIRVFEDFERETGIEPKVSWMLEQDEMRPYTSEIRSKQDGGVIERGGKFFKEIINNRNDELGLHIHFTRNGKFDVSKENQERLIKAAMESFIKAFEFESISFVGGHWYSDSNTIKILEKYGFKVDASPVPLYEERRRKWLYGKIPTPFKISTCDWSVCTNREPYRPSYDNPCILGNSKILYVPNAVNPLTPKFSESELLSLDLLDYNYGHSVEIFRNFLNENMQLIVIPFHPYSMNAYKLKLIEKLFHDFLKYAQISFLTLGEIKNEGPFIYEPRNKKF